MSAIYACLMKQFTTRTEPIRFRIDDDLFEAASDIPAATMFRLADMRKNLNSDDRGERFEGLKTIFRELLTDESYALFEGRLGSREKPIGTKTMNEVLEWLTGEGYGLRPTQPSPSSPEQSAATSGDSSTDGVQPETSTPEPSPGPGS